MKAVEILPGKSIGALRLGEPESNLPSGASVLDGVGIIDHIHFALENGRVDDVWIDDLAAFPYDLTLRGQSVPRSANLKALQELFGECAKVPGILGGTFYNCRGITIGCDQDDRPTQLRLKPR